MDYDNSAKNALKYAVEEAERLKCDFAGAEHVLLGVLHPKNTLFAAGTLCHFGMNLATLDIVREELLARLRKDGAAVADKAPVLNHAETLAGAHEFPYVSINHLLLGLAYQRESIAAQCLDRFGVDYEHALKSLEPFLGNPLADMSEEQERRLERDYLNIFSQECTIIEAKTAAAIEGLNLPDPLAGLTQLKLVGILDLGDSLAAEALRKLEVDLEALRAELIEAAESLREEVPDEGPGAAQLMSAFQNWSLFLARGAKSPKVKAEHVLMAILWHGDNLSARALAKWSVDYQKAVDAIQDVYNELGEKDQNQE